MKTKNKFFSEIVVDGIGIALFLFFVVWTFLVVFFNY
jgi:hypothetical protein